MLGEATIPLSCSWCSGDEALGMIYCLKTFVTSDQTYYTNLFPMTVLRVQASTRGWNLQTLLWHPREEGRVGKTSLQKQSFKSSDHY